MLPAVYYPPESVGNPLTNENSPLPIDLESGEFSGLRSGLYKPADPTPQPDTWAFSPAAYSSEKGPPSPTRTLAASSSDSRTRTGIVYPLQPRSRQPDVCIEVEASLPEPAALLRPELCKTEKYDVITLQETLINTGKKFKVSGYNTYTTPCENTNRGLAILVKSSIPVKRITNPIFCGDNVEVMAVRLTLDNQTLDIYNIYRNIQLGELVLSQLFSHTENTNTLIMGDFNAHHEILSSTRPSNTTGDHIYQSLNDFNRVSLLNNGQSTHIRGGRLDLSFISTVLRPFSTWQLHPDLTSDHFATRAKIDIQTLPPIPPPPPRWNQDQADWNIFQSELEKWANEYDPPQDMDQLELDLNGAIHNAANKAMPLKARGNYTYKDSWYYCPEVRVLKTRLNRVRKLYR